MVSTKFIFFTNLVANWIRFFLKTEYKSIRKMVKRLSFEKS